MRRRGLVPFRPSTPQNDTQSEIHRESHFHRPFVSLSLSRSLFFSGFFLLCDVHGLIIVVDLGKCSMVQIYSPDSDG